MDYKNLSHSIRAAVLTFFITFCYLQFTDAAKQQLRGPNICYHYDIGRYCCSGFEEVNGFCVLKRRQISPAAPRTLPAFINRGFSRGSRVKFAPKPDQNQRLVNLSPVDRNGRPTAGVEYSHGRQEEITYKPNKGGVETLNAGSSKAKTDYYIPYDMELIRQQNKRRHRTSAPEQTTPRSSVRFAPSPKPNRPWDKKQDRIRHNYSHQVIQRKTDQGMIRAEMQNIDSKDTTAAYQGRYPSYYRGDNNNYNNNNDNTMSFKQRPLVVYGGEQETTQKPRLDNAGENRIYFSPKPILPANGKTQYQGQMYGQPQSGNQNQGYQNQGYQPQQESQSDDDNIIQFQNCPEGYTSVYSPEDGQFCYPTTALTSGSQSNSGRAPIRGDGALRCPPGHDFRSSQFGDACVPFDWQPCSGEPGCNHAAEQPMVNPLFVSTNCQSDNGVFVPCRNSPRDNEAEIPVGGFQPEGGCTDTGCGGSPSSSCGETGCNDKMTFPTSDCGSQGCSDCVDGGCGGSPTSDGEFPVQAGSGMCLNGGTAVENGFCACEKGFYGSQCENDIDECLDRSPCSHECLNTVGSYKCFCPAGYVLADDGFSCILITCPKCLHGGYCDQETNQCVCPAGFTGQICEMDIDECSVPGTCSHGCRNIFGSYACLCRQGYTLLRDGRTCQDWRCQPNCVNGGVCVKNRCLCPPGYSGIICQFNNRL